jgi:hypothetical protein
MESPSTPVNVADERPSDRVSFFPRMKSEHRIIEKGAKTRKAASSSAGGGPWIWLGGGDRPEHEVRWASQLGRVLDNRGRSLPDACNLCPNCFAWNVGGHWSLVYRSRAFWDIGEGKILLRHVRLEGVQT